jgi:DNA-binding NarL/FixJ family response regulator
MENNVSVAIVDDEAQLVRTYELLFKKRRIPMAFTAYSGEEAIEKFRMADPKPVIVVIDYRLPDMSGLETMKVLLAIEPRTKIVLISGDESIGQKSLDAGAMVFMKKPTSIKDITETIKILMNG